MDPASLAGPIASRAKSTGLGWVPRYRGVAGATRPVGSGTVCRLLDAVGRQPRLDLGEGDFGVLGVVGLGEYLTG